MTSIQRTPGAVAPSEVEGARPSTDTPGSPQQARRPSAPASGLSNDRVTSGSTPPRARLPLPTETIQQVASFLPASSLASLGAASQAMKAAVAHPLDQARAQIDGVQAQAGAAASLTDVKSACAAIAELPPENRGRPLAALAGGLRQASGTMPIDDVLPACKAVQVAMFGAPATPGGAQRMAQPVLDVMEATHTVAHRLLDPALGTPARVDELGNAMQNVATIAKKFDLGSNPAAMSGLLQSCFRPGNQGGAVEWAVALAPSILNATPPSPANAAGVAQSLAQLTTLANGPHGLSTLNDASWKPYLKEQVAATVQQHGLRVTDHPPLQQALATT